MRRVLILGAAGRDFFNFNFFYRYNPRYSVVGFTAAQIPGIANRTYPKELAGDLYPKGIPIFDEKDLEKLITKYSVEECVFSYSDASHEHVMHIASRCIASGASFILLGPRESTLESRKKVLSVCATRTGAGKSPFTRYVTKIFKSNDVSFVVVRHPMPYGDLKKEAVQRFENFGDLVRHKCTIEEREEYEPHLKNGVVVYAGVDYQRILWEAENEAGVIIWDGGNNDLPFYKSDLHIVIADARRAGHELAYHPGEANFRMADVIVINKVSRNPNGAKIIRENAKKLNPNAQIIETDLELTPEFENDKTPNLKGKKVVVIEDGPTVTHGGMADGAAYAFAKKMGAKIIDPRKFAMGSIKDTYNNYRHLTSVLPAMGYSKKQIDDLQKTINKTHANFVLSGTPVDLRRIMRTKIPIIHIRYDIKERKKGSIESVLKRFFRRG